MLVTKSGIFQTRVGWKIIHQNNPYLFLFTKIYQQVNEIHGFDFPKNQIVNPIHKY